MSAEGRQKPSWLVYAVLSGACAAINGAFAKLTTTELTTAWAHALAQYIAHLGYNPQGLERIAELVIRGTFLALNIAFNGVMWGLFTHALTLSTSTVRVSVLNTAANFAVTAVLGAIIFGETLPGLWWIGAAMLVAGSVIIGARDQPADAKSTDQTRAGGSQESQNARSTGVQASKDARITSNHRAARPHPSNDPK